MCISMKYDVMYCYEASVNKPINYYKSPLSAPELYVAYMKVYTVFLLREREKKHNSKWSGNISVQFSLKYQPHTCRWGPVRI